MNVGKFVVIEGPDGLGKTSQSKALAEYLFGKWYRFPNRDTPFGKLIDGHLRRYWSAAASVSTMTTSHRSRHEGPEMSEFFEQKGIWLDQYGDKMDALAFQAIQLANRMECIGPMMKTLSNQHVVCDRYWPSGYAYGGADGLDKEHMLQVHSYLPDPDVMLLLDGDSKMSFERMSARGDTRDRYEGNRGFLDKVANNYRDLWNAHKGQNGWEVVDARGSKEEVQEKIRKAVERWGVCPIEFNRPQAAMR